MERTKLMMELWKKSEETKNPRIKSILKMAGDLVEGTFTNHNVKDIINYVLKEKQ